MVWVPYRFEWMSATATRIIADEYCAQTVEGDRYDVGAKKRVYEAAGLPELWLLDDAAKTILLYRRSTPEAATFDVAREADASQVLTSPLLPEFELPLAELFAR